MILNTYFLKPNTFQNTRRCMVLISQQFGFNFKEHLLDGKRWYFIFRLSRRRVPFL